MVVYVEVILVVYKEDVYVCVGMVGINDDGFEYVVVVVGFLY